MSKAKLIKADLAVIGAGSGGLSVAAGASQLGLKVVLFEKGEMGGDCLNTGCVPSKALIAAAKAAHAQRNALKFGISNATPTVDWPKVRAHIRGVIDTIAPIDSQERFEGFGVTVIREHARFLDHATVGSDSVQVKAKRIVIAAGSRAAVPPIPGLADSGYLTNETIWEMETLPQRLIILGAGPIGVELGQAFQRLGVQVTILEAARALARAEPEAATLALTQLRGEGVEVLEGWKAVSVAHFGGGVTVTAEKDGVKKDVSGERILVALGRTPNLDGLDLEQGGVAFTKTGVTTRPNLRSASNPRVWAVGDIAGYGQFTHMAGWHASAFVRSALFKATTDATAAAVPAVTYCAPEVAQIGLTEAEARAQHGEKAITVTKWSAHENDRAQAERDTEGFCKLVLGKGGRILGACIVGEGAGDLLQIVGVAMANKLGVRALTNIIAPYPTRGELVKRAAGAYFTPTLFSPRVKALVGVLQRF
jgi:pyruvate/2-oxoglutarate dehydrogenase complex dihydrolipoamide dehydrogenase (E3) component